MYLDQLPDIKDVRFSFGRKSEEQKAKNYVIYCRKSDERDDRASIPAQLAHCLDFARKEGLNVVGIVSEQMSARTHGRPKFTNLTDAIKGDDELTCLDS
jgi:DNA invertase Pin-like site-specific DNA recombinase